MKRIFIYRSPEPGEGGGGLGLSLAEIEAAEDENPNPGDDPKDKTDPDEKKAPEETDEEREARETAEKAEEKKKEDAAAAAEKKKSEDEEAKKAEKKEDDPNPEDDEPDDADEFFAEVDALRGDTVEVDYGDVDPLSPAGVVLRERAVEDAAIAGFEAYLETTYPKAFAFFNHMMAGKPEDEFFGQSTDLDAIPTVEEIEASIEVQKQIITKDLIHKGNSPKHAELIIKQAIEDNELEELAKSSQTNQKAIQDAALQKIKDDADAAQSKKDADISRMSTYVDEVVKTGKIGSIEIPEKDRAEFAAHIKKSIRHDNGNFVVVSTLTNENVTDVFAKEYFAFKKGNLGTIVTTAAKTENARRLKKTIPVKAAPKGAVDTGNKFVSMSELEAE